MSDKQRFGMVIDTRHCVGCQTCTVSCKISNQVPGSAKWNRVESLDGSVLYQATGKYPTPTLAFRPILCNHCENPACVENCPTGAMHKDPDNGIVSVNQDVCIGCGYCSWVCPYHIPSMDDVHHVMSKCTMCMERTTNGEDPYCVESCPANARIFGDLNDPDCEASKLIAQEHGQQYKPEEGTQPNVYYI